MNSAAYVALLTALLGSLWLNPGWPGATGLAWLATGCVLVTAGDRTVTVRSTRTGRVRTYRVYRDGHWEMVHR